MDETPPGMGPLESLPWITTTMSITEYLAKAYVINLASRTDRKREMDGMLGRLGPPVHGDWVEYFPAVKVDSAEGFPSAGVRGCFLSHLGVYKQAIEEGLPNVVVMEDDLEIEPAFLEKSTAMVEALERHKDWGFVYFGHILEDDPRHNSSSPLRAVTGKIMMGHFYAINGPVLPRLVRFFEKVLSRPPGHPDGGPQFSDGVRNTFRARNPDVLTLAAQPNMGRQRGSRSDLSPRWFDKIPGIRELAQTARSVNRQARRSVLSAPRPHWR